MLDVHARSGSVALTIAGRGMGVTALAEGQTLERLREKLLLLEGGRVTAAEGGLRNLPREVATFDLVACVLVLNSLSPDERPGVMRELFGLAAPGGILAALEIDVDGPGPFSDLRRLGRMLSGLRAEALLLAASCGTRGFRAALGEWEARALSERGEVLSAEAWAELLSAAGFARVEVRDAGRNEIYKLLVAHKE